MLMQSELMVLFNYNPTTGDLTRKLRTSNRIKVGDPAGSLKPSGYIQVRCCDGRMLLAHRIAWVYHYGSIPDDIEVDHINGIRSDNRIANLRLASDSQNAQNQRRSRKDNKSGFLGVSVYGDRFIASIQFEKKWFYLGIFDKAEEAHSAYLKKKREIHEFCTI